MTNGRFKNQLDNIIYTKFRFQFILVSAYAIAQGVFYIYYDGYILNRSEPYMQFIPQTLLGWCMVLSGILLLVGYFKRWVLMKKSAIFLLAVLWGGLFLVAITFAFGSGYPDMDWLDRLLILALTLRLSKKGVPS